MITLKTWGWFGRHPRGDHVPWQLSLQRCAKKCQAWLGGSARPAAPTSSSSAARAEPKPRASIHLHPAPKIATTPAAATSKIRLSPPTQTPHRHRPEPEPPTRSTPSPCDESPPLLLSAPPSPTEPIHHPPACRRARASRNLHTTCLRTASGSSAGRNGSTASGRATRASTPLAAWYATLTPSPPPSPTTSTRAPY